MSLKDEGAQNMADISSDTVDDPKEINTTSLTCLVIVMIKMKLTDQQVSKSFNNNNSI
jgi:hypothetical protein